MKPFWSASAEKLSFDICWSAFDPRPWNESTSGTAVVPSQPAGRCTSASRGVPATSRSTRVSVVSVVTVHAGIVVVVVAGALVAADRHRGGVAVVVVVRARGERARERDESKASGEAFHVGCYPMRSRTRGRSGGA